MYRAISLFLLLGILDSLDILLKYLKSNLTKVDILNQKGLLECLWSVKMADSCLTME